MFFFKRSSKNIENLKSIISNQKLDIELLEAEVESLRLFYTQLLEKINQNSSAILEIDDDLSVTKEVEKNSYNSISYELDNARRDCDAFSLEIKKRILNLEKMQKAIMTWVIVLCATSLFSVLLYFKII